MRFLIKIAFLVGLAAFFLAPTREDGDVSAPGLSPIALLYGVQQAVSDLGGFCERAPAACDTGREAIRFAGARIGDGLALAYSMATGQPTGVADPLPASHLAPAITAPPPPMGYTPPTTGSVETPRAGRQDSADTALVDMATTLGRHLGGDSLLGASMPGMPQPYRAPVAVEIGDEPDHPSSAPLPDRLPVPRSAPRA